MKLLIVDDSAIVRRAIEKYLRSYGMELVGTASDGEAALELFKRCSPDFVTMDITMPRIDGLACIAKMVELRPEVRILVVSALSDPETGIAALGRGAKGFLKKPFREEGLREEVEHILGIAP
jgi:two-component system chemotaxis response regulator CheY